MVGNDVVDLLDRESDPATLSPRFDSRVFSPCEREALQRSDDAATLRWELWAAKEAAYKAVKKADPSVVFSPSRFLVRLGDAEVVSGVAVREGIVVREGDHCDVRIETREGAVHAVARLRANPSSDAAREARVVQGVLRLSADDQRLEDPMATGRIVRSFSTCRLAPVFGVRAHDLEIRKRGRVPELWLRGAQAPADLSLSHHGAVVAFACEVEGIG